MKTLQTMRWTGLAVLILGCSVWLPPVLGQEEEAPDLAHYGAWQINLEKTAKASERPFTRGDTFTWFLQPERNGLRFTVFETYPKPQPDRSYFATLDGTEWPDPHGPGLNETVALWKTDRFAVYRMVRENGVPTQRTLYTVSPDGNTFTANTMVFDRVDLPFPDIRLDLFPQGGKVLPSR